MFAFKFQANIKQELSKFTNHGPEKKNLLTMVHWDVYWKLSKSAIESSCHTIGGLKLSPTTRNSQPSQGMATLR